MQRGMGGGVALCRNSAARTLGANQRLDDNVSRRDESGM
jgi:hypothetical protein